MKSFGAVILAAGDSRRIGFPKALLRWQKKAFLEKIVDTLRAAHVQNIRVVTSAGGEKLIRDNLALPGVHLLVNPDPSRGQFSSLKCGLAGFEADVVLVCLVDHPKVGASVLFELKEACVATDALAVIPRFREKRGHPIAVKKELIDSFLQAPDGSTMKEVLNKRWSSILEIETSDSGVIADIDTAEDYELHLEERLRMANDE
ncbi:MAG TPA: nucleotidyltransferase family protein [Acidobacteriota bacterium]|nr:nucleotidyltransferase family protein [Acidobacteriota bacterium]